VVQWCPDGDFLASCISASRVQHTSDLLEIRRVKKERRR